jgi:hypothetical protein
MKYTARCRVSNPVPRPCNREYKKGVLRVHLRDPEKKVADLKKTLGKVRQELTEMKVVQQMRKHGCKIESRQVLENGDIRIVVCADFS